jgi:hypothetical protein
MRIIAQRVEGGVGRKAKYGFSGARGGLARVTSKRKARAWRASRNDGGGQRRSVT